MAAKGKVTFDLLKAANRIIKKPESMETLGVHLTQLLVGSLGIKGSSLFVLNPETKEMEILASFGLSPEYLNKGPLFFKKSLRGSRKGNPFVIQNARRSTQLQYPQEAKKEGIGAIVHLPITFSEKVIGALRLYHSRAWAISEKDLNALGLLTDTLALAMIYNRLLSAFLTIRDAVGDVHTVWLTPQKG